jgi:hypothetical protein
MFGTLLCGGYSAAGVGRPPGFSRDHVLNVCVIGQGLWPCLSGMCFYVCINVNLKWFLLCDFLSADLYKDLTNGNHYKCKSLSFNVGVEHLSHPRGFHDFM